VNGWRVLAVQDDSTFLRDQIKLFMAYKGEDGTSAVQPLVLEMHEPVPDAVMTPSEIAPTIIPRELAEQIFTQLAWVLTGVSDPYATITQLRRDLNAANLRVDGLIDAMRKVGGRHG